MEKKCVTSDKRMIYINRLKQIRKKLKQTQEESFLNDAIAYFMANEDVCAVNALELTLSSCNLVVADLSHIKQIINAVESTTQNCKEDSWLYHVGIRWNSIPMDFKLKMEEFTMIIVVKIIEILSSICFIKNEKEYC